MLAYFTKSYKVTNAPLNKITWPEIPDIESVNFRVAYV